MNAADARKLVHESRHHELSRLRINTEVAIDSAARRGLTETTIVISSDYAAQVINHFRDRGYTVTTDPIEDDAIRLMICW